MNLQADEYKNVEESSNDTQDTEEAEKRTQPTVGQMRSSCRQGKRKRKGEDKNHNYNQIENIRC